MSTQPLAMPKFGIYYPFIHFRDASWLKMAALYWPKMSRIVPEGYATRDTDAVKILNRELGFTVNVDPSSALDAVALRFLERLRAAEPGALDSWRIAGQYADVGKFDQPYWKVSKPPRASLEYEGSYGPDNLHEPEDFSVSGQLGIASGFAGMHRSEFDVSLFEYLLAEGMLIETRGDWCAVSPTLAWIYKCELTDTVAEYNHLVPTTDNWISHVTAPGASGGFDPQWHQSNSTGTSFGLLALETIIPANLEAVPIDKIVNVRKRFGSEFDRWRAHVDDIGVSLSEELASVKSSTVAQAYLEEAVRMYAKQPLDDLKRGLRDVGLDSSLAQVSSRFGVPAALGAATGLGVVAAGAGIAAGLVSSRQLVRSKARERRAHPVAYLMNVSEELREKNLIQRMIAAIQHGIGIRG